MWKQVTWSLWPATVRVEVRLLHTPGPNWIRTGPVGLCWEVVSTKRVGLWNTCTFILLQTSVLLFPQQPQLECWKSETYPSLSLGSISAMPQMQWDFQLALLIWLRVCSPSFFVFENMLKRIRNINRYKTYRSERWSDCWCGDRCFARMCPDHPGCVVYRSHCEEAQIQSSESIRGQWDEVRFLALHVVAFHAVIGNIMV